MQRFRRARLAGKQALQPAGREIYHQGAQLRKEATRVGGERGGASLLTAPSGSYAHCVRMMVKCRRFQPVMNPAFGGRNKNAQRTEPNKRDGGLRCCVFFLCIFQSRSRTDPHNKSTGKNTATAGRAFPDRSNLVILFWAHTSEAMASTIIVFPAPPGPYSITAFRLCSGLREALSCRKIAARCVLWTSSTEQQEEGGDGGESWRSDHRDVFRGT